MVTLKQKVTQLNPIPKKLTREQKISWDNWIKENFTDLSDKYLKRYYEEEN